MAVLKRRWVWALALALAALAFAEGTGHAEQNDPGVCVDQDIKADLDAKRRRRFVKTRLFQKTNRHEISLRGGYYVSDIFDGAPVVGGAYSYHLTEDFAIEASGAWTRINAAGGPELERTFEILGDRNRTSILFATNLVYTPIYAKFQSGASTVRFDVLLTAGAGVVDSELSSGVAANAGIGFVMFTGNAFAFRLDFRDYIHRQQLLGHKVWVNDLAATFGVSVFLPFRQ